MKREIIPACMPEKFSDIGDTAASVRGHIKTIQLDLMDGNYVPEATWPFMFEHDFILSDLISEDEGLPLWEEVDYELDLMVERPEKKIDIWLRLGASRVIFHFGSVHDWDVIRNIDFQLRNFVQIGLAVTIHDDLEKVHSLIDEGVVDFVQVMGIEHIGYMGEPFDERCLEIISELRKKYPDIVLAVDGGVSEKTLPLLRDAGVDRFVSGSGIFGGGSVSENIKYLEEIAHRD